MSQGIHQFNITYVAEEDRLLLRVLTHERKEFRFWFTRNLIKTLWPALLKVISSSLSTIPAATPAARDSMLGFKHQAAVDKADISTAYQDDAMERPLGDSPVLVVTVRLSYSLKGGPYTIVLLPRDSSGIDLKMDEQMMHSFCNFIAKISNKAGWDLGLVISKENHAIPAGMPLN